MYMVPSYTRWSNSLQIACYSNMDFLRSRACWLLRRFLTTPPDMLALLHALSTHCRRMLRMLMYCFALSKRSACSLTTDC